MGDLPPLPDPTYIYHRADAVLGEDDLFEFAESGPVDEECPSCMRLFTADQLRSYAEEAVRQEREACAKLVQDYYTNGDNTQGWQDIFAERIRARSEQRRD